MRLCAERNSYHLNANIYSEKDSGGNGFTEDEKKFNKVTQAVLHLHEPIKKINQSKTVDNCMFLSVELIQCFKEK